MTGCSFEKKRDVACNEMESGSMETLLKPEMLLTELQSIIKL